MDKFEEIALLESTIAICPDTRAVELMKERVEILRAPIEIEIVEEQLKE